MRRSEFTDEEIIGFFVRRKPERRSRRSAGRRRSRAHLLSLASTLRRIGTDAIAELRALQIENRRLRSVLDDLVGGSAPQVADLLRRSSFRATLPNGVSACARPALAMAVLRLTACTPLKGIRRVNKGWAACPAIMALSPMFGGSPAVFSRCATRLTNLTRILFFGLRTKASKHLRISEHLELVSLRFCAIIPASTPDDGDANPEFSR